MLYCAVLLVSGACTQPPAGNRPNRQVVLGLLSLKTAEQEAPYDRLKLDALRELGWAEGVNVRLESRYADGDRQRLADDAQDLVSRGVDAIWAATSAEALAARQATTTIPIVMASAGDPVGTGLVASLREPGGNVTGATANAPSLANRGRYWPQSGQVDRHDR
jgi:putative ABC transport system substrate-binding protein